MRTPLPPPYEVDAALHRIERTVLARVSRRSRRWNVGLGLVAAVGVTRGGVGAAMAFAPTYVDTAAYTKPAYAEQSKLEYEPGDAILVAFQVQTSQLSAVGRDVDVCRIEIEEQVGESLLPDSIVGGSAP